MINNNMTEEYETEKSNSEVPTPIFVLPVNSRTIISVYFTIGRPCLSVHESIVPLVGKGAAMSAAAPLLFD